VLGERWCYSSAVNEGVTGLFERRAKLVFGGQPNLAGDAKHCIETLKKIFLQTRKVSLCDVRTQPSGSGFFRRALHSGGHEESSQFENVPASLPQALKETVSL